MLVPDPERTTFKTASAICTGRFPSSVTNRSSPRGSTSDLRICTFAPGCVKPRRRPESGARIVVPSIVPTVSPC